MVFLNNLFRHSQWRKNAKKQRRKRIRQANARQRDEALLKEQETIEQLPQYQEWQKEQERIEQERLKEEEIQAFQREERWKKEEEKAQKQWRELQKKIAQAREEKQKQNMKIKLEWEKEQERLKELKLAKERELEEKRLVQQQREKELLDFLEQGGDTPEHLKVQMESNPGKQLCPFFKKVSACRFFDVCSRNHVRPGISHTLLIQNFFSDLSLEIKENEHGSDSSLEFEKEDTYKHYEEFFYDVMGELEKCGHVKRFFTCCNHEAHLRGNVYVEYRSKREALVSYHKFNGRWYGGKQLNVEFCQIDSWGGAICGLFFRHKCPKGNSCNFLHVFHNPKGLYMRSDSVRNNGSTRKGNDSSERRSERRNWRWSESPEPLPRAKSESTRKSSRPKSGKRSGSTERRPRSKRKRRRRSRSSSVDSKGSEQSWSSK